MPKQTINQNRTTKLKKFFNLNLVKGLLGFLKKYFLNLKVHFSIRSFADFTNSVRTIILNFGIIGLIFFAGFSIYTEMKKDILLVCGRARSHILAGEMPAPEGWPATG